MLQRHRPLPLDALGAGTSLACAVHCAALPLLGATLPALGLAWLGSEMFSWGAIATSALVVTIAMHRGWRRHAQRAPGLLAVLGLALLVAAEVTADAAADGPLTSAAGGCLIAWGHMRNVRGR
ncbi:MAG: MerC domain-containing protein [Gemmatimonadales bacterium]|nr:MerC domain-containing protein [Gemmatimonadales bacterium]